VDGKAQPVEQVPFCRVTNCPTLSYISLLALMRELSWDVALVRLNENLRKGETQFVLVLVVERVCGLLAVWECSTVKSLLGWMLVNASSCSLESLSERLLVPLCFCLTPESRLLLQTGMTAAWQHYVVCSVATSVLLPKAHWE